MNKLIIGIGLCILMSKVRCTDPQTDTTAAATLSARYCSSCHLEPSPTDLDKATWRDHILPRMGAFMGVYEDGMVRAELIETDAVAEANIFPTEATISIADWSAIKEYYLSLAPDSLTLPITESQITDQWKPTYPDLYLSPPSTTYIDVSADGVTFADAHTQGLYQVLSADGIEDSAVKIPNEAIVDIYTTSTHHYITTMGSFSPTDAAIGKVYRLDRQTQALDIIIDELQRPVHASYADLDSDGTDEIIICEYGKWTGALSYWDQDLDGLYRRKNLMSRSGSIRTALTDIDQDGDEDIICLYGQGDEGFWLLRNMGQGTFESTSLLRMPPSYGSSYFTLYDMNADGLMDILYCAGDNADYPPIIKPYHGIYIYEQQEDRSFTQSQFLYMPGAYSVAAITEQHTDLIHLAAISFFPDWDQDHPEGFLFFRQGDDDQYIRERLPIAPPGRWIVMDADDVDGDTDLGLGSLAFEIPGHEKELKKITKNGLPFLILENIENQGYSD